MSDTKPIAFFQKYCCDPLKIHKKKISKDLRTVGPKELASSVVKLYPGKPVPLRVTKLITYNLMDTIGQKLCSTCRKSISTEEAELQRSSPESDHEEAGPSHSPIDFVPAEQDVIIEQLNESATALGESPVQKRKLKRCGSYRSQILQKLQQSVSKSLQLFASTDAPQPVSDADEIIQQLKEKFQNCATKSEQVQVLTVLPKSWSVRKVEQEFGPFGATNFMIRKAKKLVSEKGILSTPNPKKYPFPAEITESVTSFYKSEDISRVMPGIKDYILVRKDGHRIQEQKYLVLCNLKEAFQRYKSMFPDKKISFSKFASLRPKECVLAGASGIHSVCVCTIHQNVKLMIHGSKLGHLTEEHTSRLNGYKECLSRITCSPAGPACFLGECEKCASLDTFRDEVMQVFTDNMVDEVQYMQWTSTDRSTLETLVKPVEEFVPDFCEKLEALRRHDYIAKQQSLYLTQRKASLQDGEFVV